MITQAHLTAWQSHAPWPKRSQLEQDLRISRGVAAIFGDPILGGHLAMRGGTVLHKGHLAPAARYSEDIDLVLVKDMDRGELNARLRALLPDVLGKPSNSLVDDAVLFARNITKSSKILRIPFEFVPIGLRYAETIKVEVNLNENEPLHPLAEIQMASLDEEGELLSVPVRSYDINEMLGTKLRALMQREQGRDLFDLAHAWDLSQQGKTPYRVDAKQVVHAFEWYVNREQRPVSRDEAERRLTVRLASAAFCSDMETLLRPGLAPFDPQKGAALLRSNFFPHLTA